MSNKESDSGKMLHSWMDQQQAAERIIPLAGELYRTRGVIPMVNNRRLVNASAIDIIKAHRYARHLSEDIQPVGLTLSMLETMEQMELGAARIDLGVLGNKYAESGKGDVAAFLSNELASIIGTNPNAMNEPRDVVLYGFGRIGRILARLLIERVGAGNKLNLRAVVVRAKGDNLAKRASLLRRDSIHGPFTGSVTVDEESNSIIANGNRIQFIHADTPDSIDYTQYGIDNAIIVDNTGIWKDEAGLGLHLKSKGVAKVLLTAPAKGNIKNIVFGVNHASVGDDTIVSAASCTTNAITPVLKVMHDTFGIENGHVETVHAYTNDQNLIDNFHKGDRRGRSAPLNMVLTTTGAASAVAKALPELSGKLTGNAIRVPVANVSMAVISLNLKKTVTNKETVNSIFQGIAHTPLANQIGYTASTEVVSSDLVGSPTPGVVDSQATIAEDKRVVLYVWYDNEFGYSTQVVRLIQQMAGLKLKFLPA